MKKRAQRLLDWVAPVRPPGADRGYRRLLRWASLPVTDRRWAAPLAALALGFGLFAGIAIGPGAQGTFATGAPQLIQLPSLLGGRGGAVEEEASGSGGGESEAFAEAEEGGGEVAFPEEEASSSEFESSFPEEEESTPPAAEPREDEEPADEPEAEEPAQTMGGVVVHANPAAGSFTVVEAGGLTNAIHAAKLPAPGTKVSVPVRTLANGTYAEQGKRKQTGTRTTATIAGIVTFVGADPAAPAYTVSKRGSSVLVGVRPDPTGAAPVLPQLGAYATVTVEIEKLPPGATATVPTEASTAAPASVAPIPAAPPPTVPPPASPACAPDPAVPLTIPSATAVLWQSEIQADGAPFASSDFAGVVTAICAAEGKLSVSGDDLRQSGKDIVFTVPKSIELTGLEAGDSVAATADFEADGSLGLTGLASDERTKGADDAEAAQGDLASQAPK